MKSTKIWYWIFTGLFAAIMGLSSIPNMMVNEASVEIFRKLGYPVYLIPFLGVAKLLGVIAILVPGYPRIREWAYAGFTFELLGATYSNLMVDGVNGGVLFMSVFFLLVGGSYYFHHKRLRESGAAAIIAAQAG
jgi:apolipoprotein N-acyltransferase